MIVFHKPTLQFASQAGATLFALVLLVTLLGRLAWLATPHTEHEIQGAADFEVAATQALS